MALLQRFYDVGTASIAIDGQDISKVTKQSLRGSIAYVSQQPYLFEGTIRDNIRYGRPDATDAEVEQARDRSRRPTTSSGSSRTATRRRSAKTA